MATAPLGWHAATLPSMLTVIVGALYRPRSDRNRLAKGLEPLTTAQYWVTAIVIEMVAWMALGMCIQAVSPS